MSSADRPPRIVPALLLAVLLLVSGSPAAPQGLPGSDTATGTDTETETGALLPGGGSAEPAAEAAPDGAAVPPGGALARPEAEPIATGDTAALLGAAGAAAEAGDPERALELYEEVLRSAGSGGESLHLGHLYYNLGGALLESGRLGRAIAAYRESRFRLPRDPDVAANLRLARSRAVDDLAPPEASALARRLLPWHHALSRRELAALTALLNLLFWGLLAAYIFTAPKEKNVQRFWAAGLALTLLVTVVLGTSLAVRLLLPARVAVVLPEEVAALSEPSSEGEVRFELHAGSELRVEEGDREDGWVEVTLPGGESGWLPREQVALAPR